MLIFMVLCYFIPTVIGLLRGHKDAPAIAAINILLGWSVVGWLVSFIWALSDPRGRNAAQTLVINTAQHNVAASPPPIAPPPHIMPSDQDTAFWDSMTNKSDPDSLEEYLIRFPNGRFAQLAQNRLERNRPGGAGQAAAVSPGVLAAPAPRLKRPDCGKCGAVVQDGARFCEGCGQAVPTL